MGTTNKSGRRWRKGGAALLAFALVAAACSGDDDDGGTSTPTSDPATPTIIRPDTGDTAGTGSGDFSVRLSAGAGQSAVVEQMAVVSGPELSPAEIENVLDRLPEWAPDESDPTDFNRPAQSLAPPRPGETVVESFPPPADTEPLDVPTGPLEVLRFQPEGTVPIAPFVTITFDQPMVPLGTLAQLDELDVPATITPELAGRWQWIGTRTLRFDAEDNRFDRLPMATEYTVDIPAGTESATGGRLADDVQFRFRTPAPTVHRITPTGESLPLEPVFIATFDQYIDPIEAIEAIEVSADGEPVAIRVATADEIDSDDQVNRPGGYEGRFVAFRPVDALPGDSAIVINVGPRSPSAEGPLTSTDVITESSRTYGPLRVADTRCDETDDGRCRPLSQLSIQFTNPLDAESVDTSTFSIEPTMSDAEIGVSGTNVTIRGRTQGRTDYRVTVAGNLTDVYGQPLGDDETITFPIGDARPVFLGFQHELITLDPGSDDPALTVATINNDKLRVQIFEVSPDDWRSYRENRWEYEDGKRPPGERVSDQVISTGGARDELTETVIELSDGLDDGIGQLIVLVEPDPPYRGDDDNRWANRPSAAWVQGTNIGLDLFTDHDELSVWATDLATGRPLEGVDIDLVGSSKTLRTGSDGLARTSGVGEFDHVVARDADDIAVLASGSWRTQRTDSVRWYVFDDRALYRPGETVSVKGWVRRQTDASDAQIMLVGADRTVDYIAYDAQGNELTTGRADVSSLGGFDFSLDLPGGANLGSARLDLTLSNASGLSGRSSGHSFQIQEFRRPEFEVRAHNETPAPYIRTEPATVAVEAEYFAGGPLPDAEVEWAVTTRDASYSPPDWPEFSFGTWSPWWYYEDYAPGDDYAVNESPAYEDDYYEEDYWPHDAGTVEFFSGSTDASGTHYLRMDFEGEETDLPVTVTAEATVTDVNRQAWAAATSLLVHPAELYVGLRAATTFVRRGETLEIETIVTDIDGEAVAERALTVEAHRLAWRYLDNYWQEVAVETQTCEQTTTTQPVSCEFDTDEGGKYSITSTVVDDKGRGSRSEMTRWVTGGLQRPNRNLEQETAELIPDQANYEPGDTAEILVQAPFSPAEGLLTISRNGIRETRRFTMDEPSTVLDIDIDDTHIPNLWLQVDLVGETDRVDDRGDPLPNAPNRPAFATGRLRLDVPALARTLSVTAEPESTDRAPGQETSVVVTVDDPNGEPVAGAEVAVVVVDEAVLALTDYELQDPIDVFYSSIGSGVSSGYGRASIVLADPQSLLDKADRAAAEGAGGDDALADEGAVSEEADGDFESEEAPQTANDPGGIEVRANFDALAVFAPEVTTDDQGRSVVDFTLPDNLTRYRVMAVAVEGDNRFGSDEANITARLPLMIRPSPPRFLNFGDEFELPVVLQNQTDSDLEVDVVIQTSNLTLTAGAGQRVTVPANNRVEARFPAAADEVGTAQARVAVASAGHSDAALVSLPVYTPATAEAFATYGVVDGGAVAQPVLAPVGVFPQFGGLEINTSSTAVQALTDAVLYLYEYPYPSSDGYASRILAVAALRDVLDAFDAEGLPDADELTAQVQSDIEGLVALQNGDGGFPTWRRHHESWPYRSIQATHALVEARANGYGVPERSLEWALSYLRDIESHYPSAYSEATRATLGAYALHVRYLAGDRDPTKAADHYRSHDLEPDAMAWVWPVIDDPSIRTEIELTFDNTAVDTAGAVTFSTDYRDDDYVILHSERKTDGIILDALISEAPDSDLIPKVVAGLMAGRRRGRWSNVQENSFILLAMNNHFETFESVTPDFVARVWLGDLYAAEHEFQGRTTERHETLVPMAEVISQGDTNLILDKDGPGRLYYRLGLRYAPDDLDLDPLDRGFVVQRTYEGASDPGDVWQDDDGVWHVRAGAEVRVRVSMVLESRRTDVALIDPLPAGLEILNPALAATPDLPRDEGSFDTWWYWSWFNHQNLRDDRAEAFGSIVWAGTFEYTYVARATTPGTFVTPPTRAEEIYTPETFGRTGTDIVIVE
ncbi:MAG: hypothetical protein GY713_17660 [Actinomycetia bacterium]|nr:hypothetical protein [Actinomycetes bacterium]